MYTMLVRNGDGWKYMDGKFYDDVMVAKNALDLIIKNGLFNQQEIKLVCVWMETFNNPN